MLKLTHSFCRYTRLTCEDINHSNFFVKNYSQFSKGKICVTWDKQQTQLASQVYFGVWSQRLVNIKKGFSLKKTFINSNVTKRRKPMSDSYEPYQHAKYQIPADECTSQSSQFRKQPSEKTKRPLKIPNDFRLWEPVGKKNSNNGGNFRFRVVSYNVLAQYLLEYHPYLYTDCTPGNLKWKVRAAKLYDEILSLSPDIICLQEVQVSHLKSFYSKFEDMGYFGIFKQKTGHRQDGCAIYFKHNLFDLQDHNSVEYYQPEMPILNRDNIGLMVKLAPKSSSNTPIVVATTHLLYNPKRTDVRLAQMQVLLAEIDRFAYTKNGLGEGYLPIIITGDFNSTPDSAVVQLLDRGHVSVSSLRDNSDWERIGVTDNCQHLAVYLNRQKGVSTDFSMVKIQNSDYTNSAQNIQHESKYREMFNSDDVCHPLRLASVYDTMKNGLSYEATTYQDLWITVDYIYFSYCSSLRLVERLRLPTEAECEVLGRLPNDKYGSDHLVLAATFELKTSKSSL
ncbi:protein angel homolog 2 isoform X1 [Danaus plexippus]|uniref:protein angel homolog 2 isoform X1 n=2 Tax=Danaus plexippus TaxID=13037 RepID=UPI002AB1CCB0|nr:protein angel homolog 2 isoform X1 [Danaus plexippus]XP_032527018.2 protein angel homolog 2 isoform X1 [Danaus plexippus]